MSTNREYLGDGLYAEDDGYQIMLIAPREDGEHYVYLDSSTLRELFAFIEKKRGVTILMRFKPEES